MRERLKQLGGTLEVRSDGSGTVVSAILNVNGQGLQFESHRTIPVTAEAAGSGVGVL